ncbi:MAG: PQQ-binding-like beta-propeller repeat protein [Verrucomicrobia bacterium]|nr:PQQ-binding-like beta-propeller repeat protein [Verrucomicrobiota bacterium]
MSTLSLVGAGLVFFLAHDSAMAIEAEPTRPVRVVMRGIDTLAKWNAKQLRWTCRQLDGAFQKEISRKGYFEYLRLNLPVSGAGFEVRCNYSRDDMRKISWPDSPVDVHHALTISDAQYPFWSLFYDGRFEDSAEVAFWGVGISSNKLNGAGALPMKVARNALLKDRGVRAFLRPLRFSVFADDPWRALPVRTTGESYAIDFPSMESGRYCLRVVASPSHSTSPDVGPFAEFDLAISNPAEGHFVRLFCERQRQCFLTGEDVELNVACAGKQPVRADIILTLETPIGHRLALASRELRLDQGDDKTVSLLLPGRFTATLMSGRYRVAAQLGAASDHREILFVPAVKASSAPLFGTCMNKHNVFDTYNYWIWPLSDPAVLRQLRRRTDAFFEGNLVTMTAFDSNVHWGTSKEKLSPYTAGDLGDDTRLGRTCLKVPFANDPDLPPAAADGAPSTYNFFLQESVRVRAGIVGRFMKFDAPAMDPYEREGAGMMQRTVSLHAQNARGYPTFQGMDYGRWLSLVSMGGTPPYVAPPEIRAAAQKATWEIFQRQTGHQGALPRHGWSTYAAEIPRDENFNAQTHPGMFRQWTHFMQDLFPRDLALMGEALRESVPSAISSFNLYPSTHYGVAYAPSNVGYMSGVSEPDRAVSTVDMILACKEGSDQSDDPYAQALACAVFYNAMRAGKPVRAMGEEAKLACLNPTGAWRFLFEGVAHGASAGFFDASDRGIRYHEFISNTSDIWTHGQWGSRERWMTYLKFMQRYGTAFQECHKRARIGLLALESIGLRHSGLTAATQKYGGKLYQAYVSLSMAGLEPAFVYEHNLMDAVHPEIRALVAVGIDADLPKETLDGLRRFQSRGGVIFADQQSATLTLPGVIRIACHFNEYAELYASEFEKQHRGTEVGSLKWMAMKKFAVQSVSELQRKIWPTLAPALQSDNPFVITTHLNGGEDATYYFALNSTPAPWRWVAEMPRKIYMLHQFVTAPVRADLKMQEWKNRRLYSLTESHEVSAELQRREGLVQADFDRLPAQVYVALARAPKSVRLTVPRNVKKGLNMGIGVEVLGADGKPLAAALPLEITIHDGAKQSVLYRATSREGRLQMDLQTAINTPASALRVAARELITGSRSGASIQLLDVEPQRQAKAEAVWGEDNVIFDPQAIREFLQKRPLTIPIREPVQAQDFVRAIESTGQSARTVEENAASECEGKNWREANLRDQSMLPDLRIPRDLVIFSIGTTHPLVQPLVDADFLPRFPTEHYPGKGRCVSMLLKNAYASGHDTLLVVGGDADGLSKGMAALTALAKGKEVAFTNPWQSLENARVALLPDDFKKFKNLLPATNPRIASPITGRTLHLLPPDWAEEIGHNVSAIAASPNGGKRVAGTDSPRENLHHLGADGAVAISRKVDGLYVHQVAVTDDGITATAVTFPPHIQVADNKGNILWQAEPQTEDTLWGSLYDDNVPPEPDYFAVAPKGGRLVMSTPQAQLECRAMADGKTIWTFDYSHPDKLFRRQLQRVRVTRDGQRVFASVITYWRDAPDKIPNFEGGGSIDCRGVDRNATPEIRAKMKSLILCLNAETGAEIWRREFEPFGELQMIRYWMWENESHGYWAPPCTGVPNNWDPLAWFRMKGRMGHSLDATPNGDRLAAGDENGNIAVLDDQGRTTAEFRSMDYFDGIDEYLVRPTVKIAPDGSYVAAMPSQCFDRELRKFEWDNCSWLVSSRVYLFDVKSGVMSRGPLALEAVSDMLVAEDGGAVIFGRWDGSLNAISPTGKPLWSAPLNGGCRLLESDGVILCGASRGRVCAVRRKDGASLWSVDLRQSEKLPLPSYADLAPNAWWLK